MYSFDTRDTSTWCKRGQTSNRVGPGSYASYHKNKVLPSFASFGTSAKRMNKNKTYSHSSTPYFEVTANGKIQDRPRQQRQRIVFHQKNVFKGTERFESDETIAPGVGSYDVRTSLLKKSYRATRRKKEYRLIPVSSVPTIPTKFMKFGYVVSDKKVVPNTEEVAYEFGDGPGPARYNPKKQAHLYKINLSVSSCKERNPYGRKIVPPPCSSLKVSNRAVETSFSRHGTSSFVSKTPMAQAHIPLKAKQDLPGPSTTMYSSFVEKQKGKMATTFSSAKREGWNRDPLQPYVDPSSLSNPGPGNYLHNGSSTMVKMNMSLKPRAGFNTSEDRFMESVQAKLPGPGHYSLDEIDVGRNKKVGESNYFGTSDRPEHFVDQRGVPSSATYNTIPSTDESLMYMKMSSVFESSTSRFLKPKRVVTPTTWGSSSATAKQTERRRPGSVRMSHQPGRILRKGQIFYGGQVSMGPGPAASTKKYSSSFDPQEPKQRLRLAKLPNRHKHTDIKRSNHLGRVGPSSYDTRGNILKRTFNRRLAGNQKMVSKQSISRRTTSSSSSSSHGGSSTSKSNGDLQLSFY
jgi:hypothetical protein